LATPKLLSIHEFKNERTLLATLKGHRVIIALDEVGRGCLAGPVMAGASLWLEPSALADKLDVQGFQRLWIPLIRDSKKLTPKAREICFDGASQSFPEFKTLDTVALVKSALGVPVQWKDLREPNEVPIAFDTSGTLHERAPAGVSLDANALKAEWKAPLVCAAVALGAASVDDIDSINIWNAVQLAMARAVRALIEKLSPELRTVAQAPIVLVDGNHGVKVAPELFAGRQVTAVGGDDAFASIGLSSVMAKVTRDRHMAVLAQKFPQYAIEKHKGYATAEHRKLILQHGPSVMHRKSFLKNIVGGGSQS
jgi:ribonuclease HII